MSLLPDLRHAVRTWRSTPGFTLVALGTLALGVGATTAIWSVVYGLLLRPLPFDRPGRLVYLGHHYLTNDFEASISPVSFRFTQQHSQVFERSAARTPWQPSLLVGGEAERVSGERVTADYFRTLGVRPVIGRDFQAGEDQAGADGIVVLSERLWTRAFGRSPDAVGRSVTVDGVPLQIVGVVPVGVESNGPVDIYRPLVFSADDLDQGNWGNEWLGMVARLKPEVTAEAASADLDHVAVLAKAELRSEYWDKWGLWWRRLEDHLYGDAKPALFVLLGAVGLVLAIAGANLANLLLIRAVARGREIAVRVALGARRGQLVGQLLTESLVLSLAGGALGLGLAAAAVRAMLGLLPGGMAHVDRIGIDIGVLGTTLLVSLMVGILTGLAPLWFALRADGADLLKEGARGAASRGRLRPALAAGQVALSVMLVIGAALLGRTVARLLAVDLGFRPEGVMSFQVALPASTYPDGASRVRFIEELVRRLGDLPGVEAAGTATGMPLAGHGWTTSFQVEGYTPPSPQEGPWGDAATVSAGYFEALGMTLREGRFIDATDRSDGRRVAVVDELLAQKYWPGQSAIGRQIRFWGEPTEVVGVVGHVVRQGPVDPRRTQVYVAAAQVPLQMVGVAVRVRGEPAGIMPEVRRVVAQINPSLALFDVRPMSDRLGDLAAQPRFLAVLVGAFAVLALALAAIGVYGVLAYAVTQRTREFGIRMALGANAAKVVRLVLGDAARFGGAGIGLGLIGAAAGARLLSSQLYGAPAWQPGVFAAAALACGAILLLASWVPAWRATGVDPVESLRAE